jgi:hypothetical protein
MGEDRGVVDLEGDRLAACERFCIYTLAVTVPGETFRDSDAGQNEIDDEPLVA